MAPKRLPAKASTFSENASPEVRKGVPQKNCQTCAQCHKSNDSLLQCGRCKEVYYCSQQCQKAHWRHHKGNCQAPDKNSTRQNTHSASQIADEDGLFRQDPRSISFPISVMDGQVRIMKPKSPVQAFGLNTCAFVMVETKLSVIGWHASAWNMPGNPLAKDMAEVVHALAHVSEEGFVRGFVTPGSALTRELYWHGRDIFAVFIQETMAEFEWWPLMVTTCPSPSCNDVIEFAPEHASPLVFASLASLSAPMVRNSAVNASGSKHPPAVMRDVHGRLGLFANAPASQRDIVLETHALVFHEVPAGSRCDGCMQIGRSVKCVGCSARFCSRECCQRTTASWHGAACGNEKVTEALRFCEGLLRINDVKLDQPWRAGMGGFKMLLSLVMAARTGVGALRSLISKYKQISSFARVAEGSDGGQKSVELSKARFVESGGVGVLWMLWEQVLDMQDQEVQRALRQEASIDFDMFLDMVLKYNHQNQQGGLYYEVSFCAHSCRPNVAIKPLDLGGPLRLFALRSLRPGEQLTMTFVNPQLGRSQRRAQLKSEYSIECRCARCTNDGDIPHDELALLMGGGSGEDCCVM